MDLLVEAALAIMAMGEGGDLIHKSITENGNYDPADEDPPVDGYNYVSVSVETYEDELAQALADLAAAQAQIADYQACQQAVISKIQEYDPNFDPQTCEDIVDKIEEEEEEKEEAEEVLEEVAKEVGADPEDPTYPDNVLPAVKAAEGFEFPAGTEYGPDIISIIGSDGRVIDLNLGVYVTGSGKLRDYEEGTGYLGYEFGAGYVTVSDGEYHNLYGEVWSHYGGPYTSIHLENFRVTDPTVGRFEFDVVLCETSSCRTIHKSDWEYRSSALIGFGTSGHTFKAKNS